MTIDSFQRNPRLPHDLPHQCRSVLKCFFIIIPGLHTHLHADAVLVAVLLKQIFSAVINADMPAPPAVRRRLVGRITVINVIVRGNVLEIPVMLCSRMCPRIGTCCKVVGVVDYDTFGIVFRIRILIAKIRPINSHILPFLPVQTAPA